MLVIPSRKGGVGSAGRCTGAAWLSSARVVRCLVKSSNERNPCELLPARKGGDSNETAWVTRRKVGSTSSQYVPYVQGYTRNTMGSTEGSKTAKWSQSQKTSPSSDCSLQLDCMKQESLVIAHQHGAVNTFPGLVHTARHAMEAGSTQCQCPNLRGGAA